MDSQKSAFATNLIFYRKKRGMLQKDLAKALNIGLSTVSGWESDVYSPHIKTLYRLCEILDVSLPELLGICSNDPQYFSDAEVTLIKAYRDHPKLQKAIRIILEMDE